ncbi:hypothetical protein HRI_004259200 [Hibiscus trionum]|nr:hypothetical protein HRI_004259200 [Hibiscus trionum]
MSHTRPSSFIRESSCVVSQSDDEPSVGKKQTTGGGHSKPVDKQVTQKGCLVRYRKRQTRNATALNSAKSKDAKGVKNKCNNGMKTEKKSPQDPPTGFIHVRARRGQATDSHSLAERVRRKKISERMKILQCLVPGCEKVTGKALMLDEIISYVQSLQNQVEFLSMKLASVTVSPMFYDFGMDLEALMVKPERVNSEASTTAAVLPCLQQSNPTQASAFVDSTTATFAPSLLLHQGQTHFVFSHPQDNGSVLWDVEEQRQEFLNTFEFNDNLCSFH